MKKLVFIVNPNAGTGNKKSLIHQLEQFSQRPDFNSKILFTTHRGHATTLASNAIADNTAYVIAVGGDGTVNEIAGSLKQQMSVLGIIPTGSGNGLARHFGISMNPSEALKTIVNGSIQTIDTLLVNEYFSVNISGIGFDAHIAQLFSTYGKRGLGTYAKLSLVEFSKYKPLVYSLQFNDKEIKSNAFIIIFANGSQWGNEAKIAPGALINDGMITIGILRKLSMLSIPLFVLKLFSGNLSTWKNISYYNSPELKLISEQPVPMHIDGEPAGFVKEVLIKLIPASLKIIVPPNR